MSYSVKEVFYTLQGEGANTGRAAVFLRFSGCNLWSGRQEDRSRGVGGCSAWCDTDFAGTNGTRGGRYDSAQALAKCVGDVWGSKGGRFVVCTGGEPLLQLDAALIDALHQDGFALAVETNGTRAAPNGIDWLVVSPKAGAALSVTRGNELKLVFPQIGAEPEKFENLSFDHFFLQPMDGPDREHNTRLAVAYCLNNPQWRMSLQTHKHMGIP